MLKQAREFDDPAFLARLRQGDDAAYRALIRRFHEAARAGAEVVTIWGTGTPMREFLHVDDMAEASLFVLDLPQGGKPNALNHGDSMARSENRADAYTDGLNVGILGAVGVSGVKSTEDAQVARAGIAAIGL